MRRLLRALHVALACFAVLPAGATTLLYVYDELGRLVAEINPVAETTLYEYDAAGNVLSVSRGASSDFRLVAFSPPRGKTGDTVTIYGSGFHPDPAQNHVTFSGTSAVVTAADSNVLLVTVPPDVVTGPIALSSPNGSAVTTQPFVVVFAPVITAVTPGSVPRGATSRVTISGAHLATSRAMSFEQAGLGARLVPDALDTQLMVDLLVAGTVPVGDFSFSVTNDAGTTTSGSVTVRVTASLLGEVSTVSPPLSVHRPHVEADAASAGAMSAVPRGISVHLPLLATGAPGGDAMSVSRHISASMP